MPEISGGRADRVQADRAEAVNAERERRMAAGTTFMVTGYPDPILMTGRQEDRINMGALKDLAQQRLAIGDNTPITLRDATNVNHTLGAAQIIELWAAAVAYMDFIYRKSWALKDAPPIPADFADDSYWT